MRQLILSCGWQYSPADLDPFIKSCRRHCPDARMIMIIEPDAGEDKLNYLLENNVEISFFTAGYFMPTCIASSRFFKCLDIMLEVQGEVDRVFLADTRDVILQGNIFEEITEEGIHVFLEDNKYTCSEEYNNWIISNCYGSTIAELFHKKPIICSGTTLGDTIPIIQYLISMTSTRTFERMVEEGMEPGWDQAAHIYLFHTYRLMHTQHENGDGVGTLGLTDDSDIEILDDGRIQVYGKIPSVIHQWDRHPKLVDIFINKTENNL